MPNETKESLPALPVQASPHEGVFELAGTPPVWIWVHTCPTPNCECRAALVLATYEGREKLLERGAGVHQVWLAGSDYPGAAAELDDLIAFHIDIDSTDVALLRDDGAKDLAAHPDIVNIARRIDGDVLDAIGRLWFHGKGEHDPEQLMAEATKFSFNHWKPGEMVTWTEVGGVRRDLYQMEGQTYEAFDFYCIQPGCNCAEVRVGFQVAPVSSLQTAGNVLVRLSGAVEFDPSEKNGQRLKQLWAAYKQRHPRYLERMARRNQLMKTVGARSRAVPVMAAPKIGRNDACPCGSGKKYKKCCGTG